MKIRGRSSSSHLPPQRLQRPRGSLFKLESLEPRLLLAGDLTGAIVFDTLGITSVPAFDEAAIVLVVNEGNTRINKATQVAVYASRDANLDADDILLGSALAPVRIGSGDDTEVAVALSLPASMQAGTWHLIAKVDATQAVNEGKLGELNNVSVGPTFEIVMSPVLAPIGPQSVAELNPLTFDADATAASPQTLTFSLAGSVPAGAVIDLQSGVFLWTPQEAQGPGTYTFDVVVMDSRDQRLWDSETVTVSVLEVPLAPVLVAVGAQAADEGVTLSFTASASDADLPAQTLRFSLVGEPTGAAISTDGAFSWTPTETQGPGNYSFDLVVSDGALTDSETLTITVREVNQPPMLSAIGASWAIDEGSTLGFAATASDPDVPVQVLGFSLTGAPVGAAISADGVLSWMPTEEQGPASYSFDVVVSDGDLADSETITVTVHEVNLAPVLDTIADQVAYAGRELTFVASAHDPDLPANALGFSLRGAPAGASIDRNTGAFNWTPTPQQTGPHEFAVVVTDEGAPGYSDEQLVRVAVNGKANLAIADAAPVAEGADGAITMARFTVSLSAAQTQTVAVAWRTENGSADGSGGWDERYDFESTPENLAGALVFAPGVVEQTIEIAVHGDDFYEGDETWQVVLFAPTNAVIADAVGAGTIVDDDPLPPLSIEDALVVEGDDGSTVVAVRVSSSQALPTQSSVRWATRDGTAMAGVDYVAASGELLLADSREGWIELTILGGLEDESSETFWVELSDPVGASIGDGQAMVTVYDSDGVPQVSIADVTVEEGSGGIGGVRWAEFLVSLDKPAAGTVTIDYATVDGTATGFEWNGNTPIPDPDPTRDFLRASGTLTFEVGQQAQWIQVAIAPDGAYEGDEQFAVVLGNPSEGLTLGRNAGQGSILDDDPPARLWVDDVEVREPVGDAAGQANFHVVLLDVSGLPVSVSFQTRDGNAHADSDYTNTAGTLVFAPGQTEATIAVPILADALTEGLEWFEFVLSDALNASFERSVAIGTISDLPLVSVADVSVDEGAAGAGGVVHFEVRLSSAALPDGATMSYAVYGTTATEGLDFVSTTGTLTIGTGESTGTIDVHLLGDDSIEPDETLRLVLYGFTNAEAPAGQGPVDAIGTIVDDDAGGTLTIADVSIVEGDAGLSFITFTVTLANAVPDQVVTVDCVSLNGTAVSDYDYEDWARSPDFGFVWNTLTFDPGVSTQAIQVAIYGDTEFEHDETFTVQLVNATNALIADGEGIGTILNDDPLPTLTIADATVLEGASGQSVLYLNVHLSQPWDEPVSVRVMPVDGSALNGEDYVAIPQDIAFPPGESDAWVELIVLGDALEEGDEVFHVDLSDAQGATIDKGRATVTIADDDGPPILRIDDAWVDEGSSDLPIAAMANVAVRLAGTATGPVTVDYATADGSARGVTWDGSFPPPEPGPDADYVAQQGTLTFAPGQTIQWITLYVGPDGAYEGDESFFLRLSNPSEGASIADGEAVVTIADDDRMPAVWLYGAPFVVEPQPGGTASAAFEIYVDGQSALPISVVYETLDGSAEGGSDFVATTEGVVEIPAGVNSTTIEIPILPDAVFEGNETFSLRLTGVTNAWIHPESGPAAATISDFPTLSVADGYGVEGDEGDTRVMVFEVGLSSPAPQAVTMLYATYGGSALAWTDFSPVEGLLTIPAGSSSGAIEVPLVGDIEFERAEYFRLQLYGFQNVALPADSAVWSLGTILNDDAGAWLRIGDAAVVEGTDGDTTMARFTVTLSEPQASTVAVGWRTEDGSARSDQWGEDERSDFAYAEGVLEIAPGATSGTIEIAVYGDRWVEGDETFFVTLFDPTGGLVEDGFETGTAVIQDDEPVPVPEVSVDRASVVEGNVGSGPLTFWVRLSEPTISTVAVNFQIGAEGDTATAGEDYVVLPGTLYFSPWQTEQVVEITVLDDTLPEPDETLTITLSSPTGATLLDAVAVGTIVDDDSPVLLSVGDAQVIEGEASLAQMIEHLEWMGLPPDLLWAWIEPIAPELRDTEVPWMLSDWAAQWPIEVTFAEVQVSLQRSAGQTVTVDFATANGTAQAVAWDFDPNNPPAAGPGNDYLPVDGMLVFQPGEIMKTVLVLIAPDQAMEAAETFFINLSNAQGAVIADGQAVVTILPDEGLRIDDAVVEEPFEGDATAAFRVWLSAPAEQEVSVSYETAALEDGASANTDFTPASGTLTFAPGETVKWIAVPVRADALPFEGAERFHVQLSDAVGALIVDDVAVGTILDFPTFSIDDASVVEGTGGDTEIVFTVQLSAPVPEGMTVEFVYATQDGSAADGPDYMGFHGDSWTLLPGEQSHEIRLPVIADTEFEGDETFGLLVAGFIDGMEFQRVSAQGTIIDDDIRIMLGGSVVVMEGDEGTTDTVFTIRLSSPATSPVSVHYWTQDGSATAGADYVAIEGTLSFEVGQEFADLTVSTLGDTAFEPNEHFVLVLDNASGASLPYESEATITASIVNDDPGLLIADIQVTEGDAGYRAAVFTVALEGAAPDATVTVGFETVAGTAQSGDDFVPIEGTLTFHPGEHTLRFTIPVVGDGVSELDETFGVVLHDADGAVIVQGVATATIVDDEPGLWVFDTMAAESPWDWFPGANAEFEVLRTGSLDGWVTVRYQTVDGTALAGEDYAMRQGWLEFAPGQRSQFVSVPTIDNADFELAETFSLVLSDANGAPIVDGEGEATIVDDEFPPHVDFDRPYAIANESDGFVTLTLRLSQAVDMEVQVTCSAVATPDGGAIADEDFGAVSVPVTFAPGETTAAITIPILDDDTYEGGLWESFAVEIEASDPRLAQAGGPVDVTIVDDDPLPVVSVSDAAETEGESGSVLMNFTVSLLGNTAVPAFVDYGTWDASAQAGRDYLAAEGTLRFEPGETAKTVQVQVIGDLFTEQDENFLLLLGNNAYADLGMSLAFGTIVNDDNALTIRVYDAEVEEGAAGTETTMTFDVVLMGRPLANGEAVTVEYTTADNTASAIEGDYVPTMGAITFTAADPGPKNVQVVVNDDARLEAAETLWLIASTTSAALLDHDRATGTIFNDELAPLLTIDDASVLESAGTVSVHVRLSAPAEQPVQVSYRIWPGGATPSQDYLESTSVITIAAGATEAWIEIGIVDDANAEPDEVFYLELADPRWAELGDAMAAVTIQDDDGLPLLTLADAQHVEGAPGDAPTMRFELTLSHPAGTGVTLWYETRDDMGTTGVAGEDYEPAHASLTIAAGQTLGAIDVALIGDGWFEGDENFLLFVFDVDGAQLPGGEWQTWAIGTILDDDPPQTSQDWAMPTATGMPVIDWTRRPNAADVKAADWRSKFVNWPLEETIN